MMHENAYLAGRQRLNILKAMPCQGGSTDDSDYLRGSGGTMSTCQNTCYHQFVAAAARHLAPAPPLFRIPST